MIIDTEKLRKEISKYYDNKLETLRRRRSGIGNEEHIKASCNIELNHLADIEFIAKNHSV